LQIKIIFIIIGGYFNKEKTPGQSQGFKKIAIKKFNL